MVQSPTCPHGIFIDLRIRDGSLTPKRCIYSADCIGVESVKVVYIVKEEGYGSMEGNYYAHYFHMIIWLQTCLCVNIQP